jgi:hypothetical protein
LCLDVVVVVVVVVVVEVVGFVSKIVVAVVIVVAAVVVAAAVPAVVIGVVAAACKWLSWLLRVGCNCTCRGSLCCPAFSLWPSKLSLPSSLLTLWVVGVVVVILMATLDLCSSLWWSWALPFW